MIGIYQFYNKLTKKSYIGKSIDIESRFKSHLKTAERGEGYHIHSSISKYGLENFDFNILEECLEEDLNEREIYYIKKFNSFENGYNLTAGGDGFNSFSSPTSKFSEDEIISIREHYNKRTYSGYFEMMTDLYPNRVDEKTFMSIFNGKSYPGIKPEVFTNENLLWYESQSKKLKRKTGEKHGMSILTDKQVLELRVLYNFITVKDLKKIFSLSSSGIEHLVQGTRFTHLPIYYKTKGCWENIGDVNLDKVYLETLEAYLDVLEENNITISNRGQPIIFEGIFYRSLKEASRVLGLSERSIKEKLKRSGQYELTFNSIILKLRTDL